MDFMDKANGMFAGRVAFVTVAANGIGRAAALAFAREGAKVAVIDVSGHALKDTVALIDKIDGESLAIESDTSRVEDVKRALDATISRFGSLDLAFNNAGVEQKNLAGAVDVLEDEWDRIFDIDLRGTFLCMKYEIPLMLKQGAVPSSTPPQVPDLLGLKEMWPILLRSMA